MRLVLLSLGLFFGLSQQSLAEGICDKFSRDQKSIMLCHHYRESNDLDSSLIDACKTFGKTEDDKLDCLRSGADRDRVHYCESFKFKKINNSISCLHYPSNIKVSNACKGLNLHEDDLLQCMKFNRSIAWIDACKKNTFSNDGKMECLQSARFEGRTIASERTQDD